MDNFEEVIENAPTNSLVQKFLEAKQIFDQEYESPICVAPSEDYQPLRLFQDVKCEEYNYPTLFFRKSQSCELQAHHFYRKETKAKLTIVDRKFAYHIAIFFKFIILIHFILSSSWVHVRKAQLQSRHFNAKDVIDKPNLDNILKSKLWYRELQTIHSSPNYLHRLTKDVFAMISQLGPPTFFYFHKC